MRQHADDRTVSCSSPTWTCSSRPACTREHRRPDHGRATQGADPDHGLLRRPGRARQRRPRLPAGLRAWPGPHRRRPPRPVPPAHAVLRVRRGPARARLSQPNPVRAPARAAPSSQTPLEQRARPRRPPEDRAAPPRAGGVHHHEVGVPAHVGEGVAGMDDPGRRPAPQRRDRPTQRDQPAHHVHRRGRVGHRLLGSVGWSGDGVDRQVEVTGRRQPRSPRSPCRPTASAYGSRPVVVAGEDHAPLDVGKVGLDSAGRSRRRSRSTAPSPRSAGR